MHFAISRDGFRWKALNQDKPWLKPQISGMLMRDPWLGRGPDGVWHALWTCGWSRKDSAKADLTIGHATSKDLVHWSKQVQIPVMGNEPQARNAWAPEAVWDASTKQWVIFWATTIPGRFEQTAATGDSGYDHRIYAMTTRDWQDFSTAKLWFDPGFNCIDSTLVPTKGGWTMVFKDERKDPLKKQLRTAMARSAQGPWSAVSEPFTGQWVEGPTVLRIDKAWLIFFDHYTKPQHYGMMKTTDWKHFEDLSEKLQMPEGQRHGTAVRISEAEASAIEKSANAHEE